MRLLFSIEFKFRDKTYSGVVRETRTNTGGTQYEVRVMNARLDNWLYGHHVYTLQGNDIIVTNEKCADRVSDLKEAVRQALQEKLQSVY